MALAAKRDEKNISPDPFPQSVIYKETGGKNRKLSQLENYQKFRQLQEIQQKDASQTALSPNATQSR